jgi:hypothetical protein
LGLRQFCKLVDRASLKNGTLYDYGIGNNVMLVERQLVHAKWGVDITNSIEAIHQYDQTSSEPMRCMVFIGIKT